jgi:hypothetical protein
LQQILEAEMADHLGYDKHSPEGNNSGVFAFCFEPITVAMGLYVPVRWEYHYGLPIYILMPILMRIAVDKVFASAKEPS